ncbi:hypothetical protein F5882DRAFT_446318 [Hyaloscypha sp. PMI_1271]|nr:hypothetical protein F5882DRAFT_446318 [Hyaloscypha sp. PMI_1271]
MTPQVARRPWPANRRGTVFQIDAESLLAEFTREAEDLFTQDDDLDVTIIDMKNGAMCRNIKCTNMDEILQYIQTPREKFITTIIQIGQPYSWGELEISKSASQALFTHLDVSPGFWTVLKMFGSKENAEHESLGGFNEGLWSDNDASFEFSYTAKHVEEHGRTGVYDPWSIRQTGVYHKYDAAENRNTFILLNPSTPLTKRFEDKDPSTQALGIHCLILSAMTERWVTARKLHISLPWSDLRQSKKAILSNNPHGDSRGFSVQFSDAQSIQNLQDTIIRVSYMLELNLGIFESVLASPGLFEEVEPNQNVPYSTKSILSNISTLFAQTKRCKGHSESLLRRLDGSSVLIRSILDAKALETLQTSSRTTAELASLAREDGKKATQDARTLNTITILGFVYLPASFVAVSLSTCLNRIAN